MMRDVVFYGDCLKRLAEIRTGSVQTTVTSPPYWGLRDYGVRGQVGLEKTLSEYVVRLSTIFDEVRRVTRRDGTLWLNLGDAYNAYNGNRGASKSLSKHADVARPKLPRGHGLVCRTMKNKDLMMVPATVACALRDSGWTLREEYIWRKPRAIPERT